MTLVLSSTSFLIAMLTNVFLCTDKSSEDYIKIKCKYE